MQTKGLFSKFRRQQAGAVPAEDSKNTEVPGKKSGNGKVEANPEAGLEPQTELLSWEDVYHASGILTAHDKYDISKVAAMLHSKHIRELARDAKRASLLMALDAAGTHVEEVLQDATRRQHALDTYEGGQQRQLEEFEANKTRENAQIEAELERLTAHYAARIKRNQDLIGREKAAFRKWQVMKEQESKLIAEAIALCGKQTSSDSRTETAAARAAGASPSLRG